MFTVSSKGKLNFQQIICWNALSDHSYKLIQQAPRAPKLNYYFIALESVRRCFCTRVL